MEIISILRKLKGFSMIAHLGRQNINNVVHFENTAKVYTYFKERKRNISDYSTTRECKSKWLERRGIASERE